jgi:hypothetical protein
LLDFSLLRIIFYQIKNQKKKKCIGVAGILFEGYCLISSDKIAIKIPDQNFFDRNVAGSSKFLISISIELDYFLLPICCQRKRKKVI